MSHRRQFRREVIFLATFVLLGLGATALAVNTSYWTHTTESDFKAGTLENVVATNLGDLKLAREVKTLLESDARISAVTALVEGPGHTIYAGTGPSGVLLSIKDDQIKTALTLKSATHIFALAIDPQGKLLIGTAGERAQVLRVDDPGKEPVEIFSADGVQYIWAIRCSADGTVYAATGPSGKLFEIKPDKSSRVLLETRESNLLSLAYDGKDLLYVGTDPNGLIYRVNRQTGESFVLFDAPEAEVSALAIDAQGNVFAGTSEPREDPPVVQPAPPPEQIGRPESGTTGVPITSPAPNQPKPPDNPPSAPGQPRPIPRVWSQIKEVAQKIHIPLFERAAQPPARRSAPVARTVPGRQPGKPLTPAQPRPEGNAVYRIDREGFVTEVFRQRTLMLSLAEKDGTLIVGTGSDGLVYQIRPAAEETVILAKVDPKQVLSLLPASDGKLYMGLANVGGVAVLGNGYAPEGTYTSPVLDAQQISRFGHVRLAGTLPDETGLTISTRSGNERDAAESSWSAWSAAEQVAEFVPIRSPSARFFQYRLAFSSRGGSATPVVEEVGVSYQLPNLPPLIKSIRATPSPEALNVADPDSPRVPTLRKFSVAWDAADPNSDRLQYALYFRRSSAGPWVLLKDKLPSPAYEWDTRSVVDGRYELKVVATDAQSNAAGAGLQASRVSDALTVDNTPPLIGDLKAQSKEGGSVEVNLRAIDRTTTVAAVDFTVDGSKDWQIVLPSDNIFDSPEETVSFSVAGLSAGQHQLSVRASDAQGNTAYENIGVSVENAAATKD